MIATTDSVKMNGAKSSEATGNIGKEKRRKPYPPILRRIAARITEPAVGASTCASGSQVWTGHIGSFTPNEGKKAAHSQNCIATGKGWLSRLGMSLFPPCQYIAMMASSIRTEPVSV